MVDEWVQVTDRDSFLTARRVTREEGILIGGSGGLAVRAALEVARQVDDPDALVVVLLPDSGRGYLSKLYNDDWMRENGFLSRFTQPARVGSSSPSAPARSRRSSRSAATRPSPTRSSCCASTTSVSCRSCAPGRLCHGRWRPPRGSKCSPSLAQSRSGLLDQLFRNPDALSAKISTVMDGPFPLVDANEEVERVVPMLASGAPAVLVQRDGVIIGVVTRADCSSTSPTTAGAEHSPGACAMAIQSRSLTYDDLQRMRETRDERLELIDGELFVTPSPSPLHQTCRSNGSPFV